MKSHFYRKLRTKKFFILSIIIAQCIAIFCSCSKNSIKINTNEQLNYTKSILKFSNLNEFSTTFFNIRM